MGAFIYLICFSGTLSVFLHEFERWQQPNIDEFAQLSPAAVKNAYQQTLAKNDAPQKAIWVVLPTEDMPRAHTANDDGEWFTDAQGNLTEEPIEGWVATVRELHYYLHLPKTFGMMVVGLFGIMLIALAISGIMAHPSIIKDAFKLRTAQSYRLQQTDIHNRLSVWGLPFILMIALTGALIGLLNIIVIITAPLFFNGDHEAVGHAVFGADPIMQTERRDFNIDNAFSELQRVAPAATPIYAVFQQPNSEQQFIEIGATLPGRLTYSEIYRFDSEGNYYNHQGLADGPIGRQTAYSIYRLHFGHFGGFIVKICYMLFGFALTVVSVSGINIWLAKRPFQNWHNDIWAGLVWGAPLAISFSATASLSQPAWSTPIFLLALTSILIAALACKNPNKTKQALKLTLGMNLIALAASHSFIHATHWQVVPVVATNLIFTLLGLYFLTSSYQRLMSSNSNLTTGMPA